MKNICVFGASSSRIDQKYIDCAAELGRLLAENGFGLVFGGGRVGLMGAVAQSAHAHGGHITGVIPEKLNQPGIAYENCDELIVTATMHERKAVMESRSGGFVVLPGGYGTLEELFEVLTLIQLGYLSAPVVLLNLDGYYDALMEQLKVCVDARFTHPAYLGVFCSASTANEAVKLLLSYKPPDLPDKMEDALRKT
jgi:uncharacterized protein (TIGR00730 family)